MIPFGMFDGKKILRWSKVVYFTMLAVGFAFMFYGITKGYFNITRLG